MTSDDDRRLDRYAVRFAGDMSAEAAQALRDRRMGRQRHDTFFPEPLPYSTTVVLVAADEHDAVAQVRRALEGLGDFVGFEARGFARRGDEGED